MRRWAWIVVAAALHVSACAESQNRSELPTPLPAMPACAAERVEPSLCVLILGDSIADGVPLAGDERWWVRLEMALAATLTDREVVVDSWAVPGSRVDVLESAALDQPALGSYDIAIVIEGVNDEAALPIEEWQPRFAAAVQALEKRGLTVILGTPPPSFEDGGFRTRYDRTATAIREVAASGRPLFDIAARWHAAGPTVASGYYTDLIHQSELGQALMAEMARTIVLDVVSGS